MYVHPHKLFDRSDNYSLFIFFYFRHEPVKFDVGGYKVCQQGYLKIIGLPKSTFYEIRKLYERKLKYSHMLLQLRDIMKLWLLVFQSYGKNIIVPQKLKK